MTKTFKFTLPVVMLVDSAHKLEKEANRMKMILKLQPEVGDLGEKERSLTMTNLSWKR